MNTVPPHGIPPQDLPAGLVKAQVPSQNGAPGQHLDPDRIRKLENEIAVPLADLVEAETRVIQARIEAEQSGVPILTGGTVTFFGKLYRLAPKVPTMALLDFAAEAAKGAGTEDPKSLAVMRDLLRRCFVLHPPCRDVHTKGTCPEDCTAHCGPCTEAGELAEEVETCRKYNPGDWPRFRVAALDNVAGPDELFAVVQDVIQRETARPTS